MKQLCQATSSTVPAPAIAPGGLPTAAGLPDLPKNFDPAASEEALYRWWDSNGFFAPSNAAKGEPFVLSMPPPNVTGKLHMGHAMFVTLQDIMTRYARMAGRPTLWLPGTDHAGIATQVGMCVYGV
jgi:valyl-tRNA synthetase